jgi:spore maturation protein CgeB
MKIAIYGSSLLSAYWNGAATYYRGILRAVALLGHEITFFEPDAFDRQSHRDIDPPPWCQVVVYQATETGVRDVLARAVRADVVIKASGVGVFDDALLEGIFTHAAPRAVRVFWDVDAPATLAEVAGKPDHTLRRALPRLDLVLTYGGGDPVVSAYRGFGARDCVPVYNALDPNTHHPVPPEHRFAADLTFLGNRLPDREQRFDAFFQVAAAHLPQRRFLLGGSGWDDKPCPANVVKLGHVPTSAHNALNISARAVLNISRDSMAGDPRFRGSRRRRLSADRPLGGHRAVPGAGQGGSGGPRRHRCGGGGHCVDPGASQRDRPGGATARSRRTYL